MAKLLKDMFRQLMFSEFLKLFKIYTIVHSYYYLFFCPKIKPTPAPSQRTTHTRTQSTKKKKVKITS